MYNPAPMLMVAQWLSDQGLSNEPKYLRWCARAASSPMWRGFRLTEATLRGRLRAAENVATFLADPKFNSLPNINVNRSLLATALADAKVVITEHLNADPSVPSPLEDAHSNKTDAMLARKVRQLMDKPGIDTSDEDLRDQVATLLTRFETYSAMFRGSAAADNWFAQVPGTAKQLADRGKNLGNTPDGRLMTRASSMLKALIRAHYGRASSSNRH